ncbi:hypothetical protein LY76DRAFT_20327 [Colletotrichum caudatum]|nr:hypothetical protein LY76DRAFT_20327 [Colletotrichum caudatum]
MDSMVCGPTFTHLHMSSWDQTSWEGKKHLPTCLCTCPLPLSIFKLGNADEKKGRCNHPTQSGRHGVGNLELCNHKHTTTYTSFYPIPSYIICNIYLSASPGLLFSLLSSPIISSSLLSVSLTNASPSDPSLARSRLTSAPDRGCWTNYQTGSHKIQTQDDFLSALRLLLTLFFRFVLSSTSQPPRAPARGRDTFPLGPRPGYFKAKESAPNLDCRVVIFSCYGLSWLGRLCSFNQKRLPRSC